MFTGFIICRKIINLSIHPFHRCNNILTNTQVIVISVKVLFNSAYLHASSIFEYLQFTTAPTKTVATIHGSTNHSSYIF